MHDERSEHIDLSPSARARRSEILDQLRQEAPRAALRRRQRRRAIASVMCLAIVGVVFFALPSSPAPQAPLPGPVVLTPPSTDRAPTIDIATVATSADVVSRYRLEITRHPDVEIIDDAQLVQTLTELGRPAGVARMGEQVVLSADVADHTFGEPPESSG